jgi:hypothetical protein
LKRETAESATTPVAIKESTMPQSIISECGASSARVAEKSKSKQRNERWFAKNQVIKVVKMEREGVRKRALRKK